MLIEWAQEAELANKIRRTSLRPELAVAAFRTQDPLLLPSSSLATAAFATVTDTCINVSKNWTPLSNRSYEVITLETDITPLGGCV